MLLINNNNKNKENKFLQKNFQSIQTQTRHSKKNNQCHNKQLVINKIKKIFMIFKLLKLQISSIKKIFN